MHFYRLYYLDHRDRVNGCHLIACEDDEAAVKLARADTFRCPKEIWDGPRKVVALTPDGAPKPPPR